MQMLGLSLKERSVEAFSRFSRDETGAVTVDWVVITAGICALGLSVAGQVGTEAEQEGEVMAACITHIGVAVVDSNYVENGKYEDALKEADTLCQAGKFF